VCISFLQADFEFPVFVKDGGYLFSSDKEAMVHTARIEKVICLADENGINVSMVIVDTGGTTDLTPTKDIFFTLYKRGEMFSTDASFRLGAFFSLQFAEKVQKGIYKFKAKSLNKDYREEEAVYIIDATNALKEIRSVTCGEEESGCAASKHFRTRIVFKKSKPDFKDESRYTTASEIKQKIQRQPKIDIPVGIEIWNEDEQGCDAQIVRGISRHGDGFIAVRSGPGVHYKMIDKLKRNGFIVTACDRKGKWMGIIYGGKNCRKDYEKYMEDKRTANRYSRAPYTGPCKSGWVFDRYLKLYAE
jgi:hypothetical protein